jgi:hypothetical protein
MGSQKVAGKHIFVVGGVLFSMYPEICMTSLRTRVLWTSIVVLTALTVALFMFPAWIIQPFKYQAPGLLSAAIKIRTVAPLLTLLTLAGLLLAGRVLWLRTHWISRSLIVLAILLSGAAALMSRMNYFEWMFHPDSAPGFLPASDAHLKDTEMVMSVHFGNDVRAYPILQMGYHHIVNDTVNGVPIVVTY